MKLKSFLIKLFLGEEIIDKVFSSLNGEILIYQGLFGQKSMRIGGVSQSGGLVVNIWKKAINEVKNRMGGISSCLILGLGCGDAARLVSQKWPEAKITGIEIDPAVIEVGKKYFRLKEIPNLEVVRGDAIEKIENQKSKFDLVLVDLYLGKNFPKEAESKEFLESLKKITTPDGIIVFNRFNWGVYRKQAEDFKEKLRDFFPKVWVKKTVSNLLLFSSFSASKRV